MRNTLILFSSIALTVLSWGLYGPVLKTGQDGMSTVVGATARLRPFVCVGLAYFLIGVIVPSLWLHFRGEKGEWTVKGIIWSLAGGAVGAIGALGIILAFTFGGRPIYVMPLVFGGAPVVNAFLTIYMSRRMKDIGPLFLAGLVITILGAVVVLLSPPQHAAPSPAAASAAATAATASVAAPSRSIEATGLRWFSQMLAIALTIACWGSYGPVLHKGQAAMYHSRMRPLVCVGLAYFLIAVIVPYFFLGELGEASTYLSRGTLWALAAGAFGAAGALGIIMAFNAGGKPVYVMPLVFGGAPVINTLVHSRSAALGPLFLAGLLLVIAGSAMVLVFAPRGEKSQEPEKSQESRVESRGPEGEIRESGEASGS